MKMQSVCESRDMSINDIERTLRGRSDIWRLLKIVNENPELIEIVITLVEIQSKKDNVQLNRLKFIPARYRVFFERKAINGVICFNDYLDAISELRMRTKDGYVEN